MDKNKVYCKICCEKTKYTRQTFAKHHLKKNHRITSREYYDKFKNNKEGFCKVCGHKTAFRNIINGYAKFCSNLCSLKDKDVLEQKIKKRLEGEKIKYNGKTYLQTDIFQQKARKTKKKRYGDKNYCNTEKIAMTKKRRYGDASYCNVKKIQKTMMNRYGGYQHSVERYKEAMMDKYGVDNYFKTNKFRRFMIKKCGWIKLNKISKYEKYKRDVKKETKKWGRKLYLEWNGLDYYDNKKLITNEKWRKMHPAIHVSHNKNQPTIDHKISVIYGFKNNIPSEKIGHISNLCICSRHNNVVKNYKNVIILANKQGGTHGSRK